MAGQGRHQRMKKTGLFFRAALCGLCCALVWALALLPRPALAAKASSQAGAAFSVMATTFPVWLLTRAVCQDVPGVRVELFVPAQTGCPHEFTPSPAELQRLASARAIVINGLGLEAFLDQPLRLLEREHLVIDAGLDATPLSAPDGDAGHGAQGVNPHIFAGPAQAALMVRAIGAGLARKDPAHAKAYLANAQACAKRLDALAQELAAIGKNAPRKGIVLQHDDLAYLAHEAGLEVLAVLRVNDEASAISAGKLKALLRLMSAERPVLIAGEPPAPDRAVELLSLESGVPFALLDPVASGPADAPPDYYERVMRANIQTLRRYFHAP